MSNTEQTDAEHEYREPTRTVQIPDSETPVAEYTVKQLRARIAYKAGMRRRPDSPLTMSTLNSVHAYLTGEFAVRPAVINTPKSPGREKLREEMAVLVYNESDGQHMDEYVPSTDEGGEINPRAFRRSELEGIFRQMITTDDQREWTP